MRHTRATVLPLLLALPGTAQAAAYYFVDAGTRAMGRGDAFVAGVDDLSAQYYNPAGLIRLDRSQAYLDLSAVDQYVYFLRADEPENSLAFDPVENQARLMAIPALGVGSHLGLKNVVFAFGFYSPFAPTLAYPEEGSQRYVLINATIWKFDVGPSAAVRLTDWLTVGAGVAWTAGRIEQRLKLTTLGPEDNQDNVNQEVDITERTWDKFIPTWNAGLLVQPLHNLSIGFSVVPPIHVEAKGSITADFTNYINAPYFDGTSFSDPDIRLLLTLPLILRAGVAWDINERAQVELDGVYEGWHVVNDITLTDIDLTVKARETGPLPGDIVVTNDIKIPADYQDAYSIRLGGEYDLTRHLSIRLGGYHETPGVPLQTQGVAVVDGNKWAVGTGATWHTKNFDFDVGVARSWLADRDIANSELKQLFLDIDFDAPDTSKVIPGKVVGNGHFQSYLTFASAGVTWKFGKPPS
jgi:long-chain fatty acid transport protein